MATLDYLKVKQVLGIGLNDFELDEDGGCWHETDASLRERIGGLFGFQAEKVVLMESSGKGTGWEDFKGHPFHLCDWVAFQVCGIGYSTVDGMKGLVMNPAYDDAEGK